MKLKNEFVDDLLNRKEIAKKYVTFINQLTGNHTIALDAPWGSGKTKFIEFISDEFDKQNDIYIIYNAWENDYTDEPLLSLMNDFSEQIIDKKYVGKDELKEIITHSWNAVKLFGKGLTKGVLRLAGGSDALKDFGEGGKELTKAIAETSDTIINDAFKELSESKKSRQDFTIELQNTIKKILEEKQKQKMVIVIDELDRCKPTFAIELLENIKHLFDIEEITFLIAVDKIQLAESIKSVYGSGFDANTYLHRFFDIDLHLKNEINIKYFKAKTLEIFSEETWENAKLNKYLTQMVQILNLTLRDFERILYETLLVRTLSNHSININFCIYFLIIKYKEPTLYYQIIEDYAQDINKVLEKFNGTVSVKRYNLIHYILNDTYKKRPQGYSLSRVFSEETIHTLSSIESTL